MLYFAYQTQADLLAPLRVMANMVGPAINYFTQDLFRNTPANGLAAMLEMLSRAGLRHGRPAYGITKVTVGHREVAVREEPACVTPFGTLLHFKKDVELAQPRVLLVAPLSGHFATLLRNTVETMLPEHDVYITDWHNARDVPLSRGRFGFDDYVDHIIRFLERIGPGGHVVAVCQPCVQVLVAAAVMAEAGNPAVPHSMTLMAGPIDCRVNPTKVNELATGRPIEWFERRLITPVPPQFAGAGRRVYPGFMQLTAFMSMNLGRHVRAHLDIYDHIASGDRAKAEASKAFYDEYFAVLDLPAEFYLETVRMVFQEHLLPRGRQEYRGRRIDPKAIRRSALLTVEGEKDDICAVGQTWAAHDLCTGLRPSMKKHHLQPGVGHYGVFSGRRWQKQIYPLLRDVIRQMD